MKHPVYSTPRGHMSEQQARRWVRNHWRSLLTNADAPDCIEMNDPLVSRVWRDETLKIAEKI